ncbi:MAG: hypothetical protein GTO14_16180 [Anaerolineales bacterium]|nr:hypothetical protein [Anaerolineales bacterium]
MYLPEFNLVLAQAMLDEIEHYVITSELYWPMSMKAPVGMPPFPRFTPGALLLTLDQLEAQLDELTPLQANAYQLIKLESARMLNKWPVALERKATQELRSRLNLWQAYLIDLEERNDTPGNYVREVRNRVIFERISDLAARQAEAKTYIEAMPSVDSRLRAFFDPGDFIWDPRLRTIYPTPTYWFLYGTPKIQLKE